MKPIERTKSLTQIATDELRDAIINGSLSLGELLSENNLAATLGISRTPVREALVQLRREGLVTGTAKGTRVFTLSAQETKELCQYRYGLESLAITEAIQHNQNAYHKEMSQILQDMVTAKEEERYKDYFQLDATFHESVFSYCENRYLAEAYQMIAAKISALRNYLSDMNDITQQTLDDHTGIVSAIGASDTDAAKEILDRHINSVNNYFSSSLADITEQ